MGSLRSMTHNPASESNRLDTWVVALARSLRFDLYNTFPSLCFQVVPSSGEKETIRGEWKPKSGIGGDIPGEQVIADAVVKHIRNFVPPDKKNRMVAVRSIVSLDPLNQIISGTFYVE